MLALQSQIVALSPAVDGMRTTQEMDRVQGRRKFQILNGNFRQFAMQPVAKRQANNQKGGAAAEPNKATCASVLRPNPRTLQLMGGA
jgi:hypothetical protein